MDIKQDPANNVKEEVDQGIALADRAGGALDDMIEDVQHVADALDAVAATQEQSATGAEASQSLNEISTVTSQNAQGVLEIAEYTDDLDALSDRLVDIVDQFTFDEETTASHVRTEELTVHSSTERASSSGSS